ncbi:hypothetical protein ACH5RR_001275 [Cinchona calisaya]|uniref:Cytochrome P450 n=1 Tax=Cinchona calisaya TaxID=153742 RepID=A0ABD3B384_9GENT
MIPLLCLLALVITGLTHWVYRWRNPKCNGVLPPGSMGFPIIGETLQFFSVHPLEGVPPFISKRVSRYGTFFKTSIVGQPVVVSTDPEINHHIFQQEGKLFQCWYTESAGQLLGEQGWSVHSGAMHKYIRSLALRLIGPESLKDGLLPEMDEMTQKHLHLWTGHANIDVKEATTTMIFALAAKKLLCCNEEEASKLGREFKDFSNGFISFPLYVPGTACYAALKGRRSAINVIKNTLDQRRSSTKRNNQDFLDHLLEEMEDEEAPLNESIAVDLVFLLFFAAYETTSSAITLAIKFLNDYPEALKKLKEENETIIRNREKKESVFTWAEYKSMTFTNMVINETVRLANIVPGIFRKVMDDVQIKGNLYVITEDSEAVVVVVFLSAKWKALASSSGGRFWQIIEQGLRKSPEKLWHMTKFYSLPQQKSKPPLLMVTQYAVDNKAPILTALPS